MQRLIFILSLFIFYSIGGVSIPQAVGTVTSSPLFSLPFGQGLEMCGPHRRFAPLLPRTLRRIPQAVSTVATEKGGLIFGRTETFQYRKR